MIVRRECFRAALRSDMDALGHVLHADCSLLRSSKLCRPALQRVYILFRKSA